MNWLREWAAPYVSQYVEDATTQATNQVKRQLRDEIQAVVDFATVSFLTTTTLASINVPTERAYVRGQITGMVAAIAGYALSKNDYKWPGVIFGSASLATANDALLFSSSSQVFVLSGIAMTVSRFITEGRL